MDLAQLQAFAAAVEAGTLDGAARLLHITPSAVSQRLRALESATGQVLLVRSRPVVTTEAGAAVLRLARQVQLLVDDTTAQLAGSAAPGPPALPVAVNADSLATWFLPAVAPLADRVQLDVRLADQTLTTALLRDGTVMAAVTADPDAVPGCSVARLGAMTYRPMATTAFARTWFGGGTTPAELRRAPVVVFDRTDDLQAAYLRRRTHDRPTRPRTSCPPARTTWSRSGSASGGAWCPICRPARTTAWWSSTRPVRSTSCCGGSSGSCARPASTPSPPPCGPPRAPPWSEPVRCRC